MFCSAKFVGASGLSHHLETGSCKRAPFLNREKIHRMVRERDPHGVISNKQIEWHERADVAYSATNLAFNGSSWECYLCHRKFQSLPALNQHLKSPAHEQDIYHCPNFGGCSKQFVTLAALFNHLESESCKLMRFDRVQQQVSNVFQGRILIAFS
jgi:hypothetical protein